MNKTVKVLVFNLIEILNTQGTQESQLSDNIIIRN